MAGGFWLDVGGAYHAPSAELGAISLSRLVRLQGACMLPRIRNMNPSTPQESGHPRKGDDGGVPQSIAGPPVHQATTAREPFHPVHVSMFSLCSSCTQLDCQEARQPFPGPCIFVFATPTCFITRARHAEGGDIE